jgi:hypothetical protein
LSINLLNVGKNKTSREPHIADENEKPIYSNILKSVMKNKAVKTNSKIIKDIFPNIL